MLKFFLSGSFPCDLDDLQYKFPFLGFSDLVFHDCCIVSAFMQLRLRFIFSKNYKTLFFCSSLKLLKNKWIYAIKNFFLKKIKWKIPPVLEKIAWVIRNCPNPPSSLQTYDIVVAADGSGNFTTIQEAVDSTNSVNATIYIKKGIYQEKLVIPTEKSGSEQRLKFLH
jgi:hypothetical protein